MTSQSATWLKENERILFDLTPGEMLWRDRQKMLERNGYMLRPRFRPEWVPSNTDNEPLLCEDSIFNPALGVVDATRISDGAKVAIKSIHRGSSETKIATFISSDDLAKEPKNHCVPVLDVVRDESEPTLEFLVMPLLRPLNKPDFCNVEEMLEGLSFMHSVGVAHRDFSDKNIMFDAAGMLPKGFHAGIWHLDSAGSPTTPLRRSQVDQVNYYFTEFGLSSRFQEGDDRTTGT